MTMDKRTIFLLDGGGAALSALALSVVLPAIQPWVGLPTSMLYLLAGIAAIYAVYSLSCFWLVDHTRSGWLRAIVIANLTYCVLTLSLVAVHWGEMTLLGVGYFIAEITIIGVIVAAERAVLRQLTGDRVGSSRSG